MAKTKTLHDPFHATLKDIYFAEKKILGALSKMAKAAQEQELKDAFLKHEKETQDHVARLEKVFGEIGQPVEASRASHPRYHEGGEEIMKEYKGMPLLMPVCSRRLRRSSTTRSRATGR